MNERVLDVRGLKCPMPIVKAKQELATVQPGEVLKVLASDPGSVLDFQGWAKANPSLQLIGQSTERDEAGQELYIHRLARRS